MTEWNPQTDKYGGYGAYDRDMAERSLTRYVGRWTRSKDGLVAGVCAGIGRRFDIDPWLVRFGWLVSVCFFGTGLAAYLILAFCLPREDEILEAQGRRFLGVCSRISRSTGYDVGLLRVLAVVLGIASFGLTVLVYFVLNFVLDEREDHLTI